MSSQNRSIKNKKGICLRPPNWSKGETILNRIKPIVEHKQLDIVRIGILAGAKDDNPEIEKYEGGVKIRTALYAENPQTKYSICLDPEIMQKKPSKFTWTKIDDLIHGLEHGIKRHPELRFYINYLLILDKGTEPNFPHVSCEFNKIFEFAADSQVGIMYAPEKKSLDLEAIFRNPEWIDKGGYWKKHKRDLIPNIYTNLPVNAKYVEAQWAKNHAHNLTHLKKVFMVRACDLLEQIIEKKQYEPLADGKCYEVDIDEI